MKDPVYVVQRTMCGGRACMTQNTSLNRLKSLINQKKVDHKTKTLHAAFAERMLLKRWMDGV